MAVVIKQYLCDTCGEFEIDQCHDEVLESCVTCGGDVERLIGAPIVAKDSAPRTIGSMIDQNNRRNPLTREKVCGVGAEKKLEQQTKIQKIGRMSDEQKRRYIETGKL